MFEQRVSGVLVHPTSFPSPYGIGDLGSSAYEFIDFLEKGNQSIWQILPLNPTGFGDSPYQSFSTFAGNPLLISPEKLQEEGLLCQEELYHVPEFSQTKVEYGKVIEWKEQVHKKAYENFIENKNLLLHKEFELFCKVQAPWLDDYCLFVALKSHFILERSQNGKNIEYNTFAQENKQLLSESQIDDYFFGACWFTWPKDIAKRQILAVTKWSIQLQKAISYHKWLQFMFAHQWNALKTYANEKNIQIVGDMPIFVALDSADVWSNTELFLLDENNYPTVVAGVPPDYFSATGQLWGNPLYNWKQHEKTNFKWWIHRVSHVFSMVDILRIDHFRAFDTYWAIPYGEKTAQNGKWEQGPGDKMFVALKKELGELPIIAEDLGIITKEVEDLRDSLQLPGMKVLQFAFEGTKNNVHMPHMFASSLLVLYTGTHDNNTTMGWYATASEEAKDQFRRYLNVSGEFAANDMVRLAFMSCAKCVIVPMQDILSLHKEARMNTPGVSTGNWQFRYTKDLLQDRFADNLAYLSDLFDRNISQKITETPTETSTKTLTEKTEKTEILPRLP